MLDLAVQFNNASAAKNDLRKAYEKCNDIPQETRTLIDTFLKQESDKDYEMNLAIYRKDAKIEKQIETKYGFLQVFKRMQDPAEYFSTRQSHIYGSVSTARETEIGSEKGADNGFSVFETWSLSIRMIAAFSINNKSAKVVVSQHANNRRVQLLGVRCAFVYDSETFKKIWSDDPDDLSIQVTIPSNLNVVLVSPYSKLKICHDAVKESHDISRSKTASISLKKDHREILKMLTRVHGMDFGLGYLCESRSIQVFQLLDLSSNSCYPATMPSNLLRTMCGINKFGIGKAYGLMEKPVVHRACSVGG
ncbi:hypothetical protein Tco_0806850 [Tanacetum coccineum]